MTDLTADSAIEMLRDEGRIGIVLSAGDAADLRRLIESLKQANERQGEVWRTIETAPKDGTWVLTYRNGDVTKARWQATEPGYGVWGGVGWRYPSWSTATHWMPLSAAPLESPAGDEQ